MISVSNMHGSEVILCAHHSSPTSCLAHPQCATIKMKTVSLRGYGTFQDNTVPGLDTKVFLALAPQASAGTLLLARKFLNLPKCC